MFQPLYTQRKPGNNFTGSWVRLRAGLDSTEYLTPLGFVCHTVQPAVSQYPKVYHKFRKKFISYKQVSLKFHLLPAYSSVKCRWCTRKPQSVSSRQLQFFLSGPQRLHIPVGTQVLHLVHQFCVKLICL